MPGFDNNTVYANNVDFSGSVNPSPKITADGQMLIGSTATPNIKVGIPTGSTGIVVTTGSGSLDISYAGSRIEQIVYGTNASLVTCSTQILNDDTIPQITEGDQILTCTITPKKATNLLIIEVTVPYYAAVAGAANIFALFQDANTDAIAACLYSEENINSYPNQVAVLRHIMTSGTTSATTFQVRAGQDAGGGTVIINCNGRSGLLALGGTEKAIITINEFNSGI